LTLQFEVAWEPRVRPIAIKQRMDDVRAVDDTGAVIELDDTMAEFEARIDPGSFSTLLELPLVPPSRAAQRMASISGKLTVILPGGIERFRFENLAGARLVEQRKGSATVTLEQVRKNNDVWEIRVLVRYDEASLALESHRGWIFNNPAYLVGADGERVQYDGFETTRQSEDEVGMAYLFVLEKELDNYAFVYETPATLLTLPVEYKLTDIDLP